MANDPRDSRRKDKLITSHHILIDIYKGKNEMGWKVNSKVLSEGQQKELQRDKGWRTNVITIFRYFRPFAKLEHEVF